jgi:hypothetical protein
MDLTAQDDVVAETNSPMVYITTIALSLPPGASRRMGIDYKSSVRNPASPRPEQSPLPTLAGFVFVAENVASHDGPLSNVWAQRGAVFDNLTWRTRRSFGPCI